METNPDGEIVDIHPMRSLLVFLLFVSTTVGQINKSTESAFSQSISEPACKLYGYWDHTQGPGEGREFITHVNVGKSLSASVDEIIDQGIQAIPMIEGFSADDSPGVWRDRLKDKASQLSDYTAEQIPFIILIDEPYSRGWTDSRLEELLRQAKQVMPQFRFAYTVKQLSTSLSRRPDRRLPQNADYIGINYYPFRSGTSVSRSDFENEITDILQDIRQKIDTELFIVGQAFYDNKKWIEPPAESPLWYAEIVQGEPDITGLLWYEWRKRSREGGTVNMPELYEKQQEAFNIVCPN